MMKKMLCGTATVILYLFAFAQDDSLRVTRNDTLQIPDTLSAKTSLANIATRQQIYKLKPAVDIPVFAVGAGWSAYAFTKIYSKEHSTEETILSLDKNDINWFDRWAVRPYNKSIDKASYYPFYASTLLPFLFLTGKETSKDFFKLSFLFLESMSITGFLYTGSVYLTNRYRPYAYSSESTMEQRTRGGAKNSFYAGHVALVATSTFFMAKVYNDYHPESKAKWVFYSLAGAATGSVAYMRYRAGQHFPSDILLGITQGTLTGILVPHFHKNKLIKDPNLSLMPYSDGESNGINIVYRFR
ncbi:MAG TPA: phosphatase PAP2 family protein [Chitinophagaceae bacterium]|jgi:membrane-associated phospholipid phosphatase|nr:phosphatase PAP2 family protein [Chitinophagaceae bacterium]